MNIDKNSITDVLKIERICHIIDNEIVKPEKEIDNELVLECYKCIDELTPENEHHTHDELMLKLDTLKSEQISGTDKKQRHSKHFSLKFAVIAAALLLILFSTFSVAAVANGYGNAFEYISAKVSELLKLKPGDVINEEGMTVIINGKAQEFGSIEEFINSQAINIMYPSALPDGIVLKKIVVSSVNEAEYDNTLLFCFSPSNIDMCLLVSNQYRYNFETMEYASVHETPSGNKFYFFNIGNGSYQAVCQKDGHEYKILSSDYDKVIFIIDNMKEAGNLHNKTKTV